MIIKVCGMRDADNIRSIDLLPSVDWMGLIFYPRSSRFVSEVPGYLPQHCKRVGVFVNASIDEVERIVMTFRLDMVQLHGNETPAYISDLRQSLPTSIRILKMIPISGPSDLALATAYGNTIDYFLFETKCEGYGGSGQQFDWSVLQQYDGSTPFLLTGGIGPDDISKVAAFKHPRFAGIDINSRFELSPAMKDAEAIKAFTQAIKEKL